MSLVCSIIAIVLCAIHSLSRTPMFTCDVRPTALILFWYLFISILLKHSGVTAADGVLAQVSTYLLITWYCVYNLAFIILLYFRGDACKRSSMVVLSFFIEINILLLIQYYFNTPKFMTRDIIILGFDTHAYEVLRFMFNLLLLFVFKDAILTLVKRGYKWSKGSSSHVYSPGSSRTL